MSSSSGSGARILILATKDYLDLERTSLMRASDDQHMLHKALFDATVEALTRLGGEAGAVRVHATLAAARRAAAAAAAATATIGGQEHHQEQHGDDHEEHEVMRAARWLVGSWIREGAYSGAVGVGDGDGDGEGEGEGDRSSREPGGVVVGDDGWASHVEACVQHVAVRDLRDMQRTWLPGAEVMVEEEALVAAVEEEIWKQLVEEAWRPLEAVEAVVTSDVR